MKTKPPVSVLLPTYNRADTISRSIDSVLNQTFRDYELIIIDDGSTDDTRQMLAEKGYPEDPRVRYVYRENGGCQAARNTGASLAEGEWLAFADSDDLWEAGKLAAQLSLLKQRPGLKLVSCAYDLSFPDGHLLRIPDLSRDPEAFLPGLLHQNWIGSPTILVHRESYLALGGLNEDYPALDDWELSLRFLKTGYEPGFVNEVLVHAFVSKESMSGNAAAYYDSRCRLLADYYEEYIRYECFQETCGEILARAEGDGILEPVKNIMALRLSERLRGA